MPGGIEEAIVRFAVQGSDLVAAASDKVVADMTSAERAGKSAEKAANEAERSASRLGTEVREVLHSLHAAASVARNLVKSAGGEGEALDVAESTIGGVAAGFRLGNAVGGPVVGAVAGLVNGVASLTNAVSEMDKRQAERDRREQEQSGRQSNDELYNAMLHAAGVSKLDRISGGEGRLIR